MEDDLYASSAQLDDTILNQDFLEFFSKTFVSMVERYQKNTEAFKGFFNISSKITSNDKGMIIDGGATLLHLAVLFMDLNSIKILLKYNAEVNTKAYHCTDQYYPLDFSQNRDNNIRHKDLIIKELLLKRAHFFRCHLIDILCDAVSNNNLKLTQFLLKNKFIKDLNLKGDSRGYDLPIHHAVKNAFELPPESRDKTKSIEMIAMLLQYGASPNVQGAISQSLLHKIALYDKILSKYEKEIDLNEYKKSFVELLIISGADRTIVDGKGKIAESYNPKLTAVIEKVKQYWTEQELIARGFLEKHLDSNGNAIKQLHYELLGAWLALSLKEKSSYIALSYLTFKPRKWPFPQEISSEITGYVFGDALRHYRLPIKNGVSSRNHMRLS